jgi:hypothetical protein
MPDQNTTADGAVSTAGLETLAARLDAIAAALLDKRTCKTGFEIERLMGWLGSLTEQTAMELRAGGRIDSDGRCMEGIELSTIWPERTAAFLDELAARAAAREGR